jgi:hypothetical protein
MNKGLEVRSNGRNLLHPRTLRSNIGDEADRAEAEAWSVQMQAYGGPAQPSQPSDSALMADSAGLRWNASAARRARACPLMQSADLALRQSGNLKRR